MSRQVSTYLDSLRLLAALLVVIGHVDTHLALGLPRWIAGQAGEAVAVFFVLSGFFMRFVTTGRERDWRAYGAARAARMISVVPLALLFTLACDHVGWRFAPDLYAGRSFFNPHTGLGDIGSALSFTNERWFHHVVVGSNEPYWSLGFEVPFYIGYALIVFLHGRSRALALTIWTLFFGPRILIYAPLWALGVLAFELLNARGRSFSLGRVSGGVLFFGSFAAYGLWRLTLGPNPAIFVVGEIAPTARSVLYFTTVGAIAVANIAGFAALASGVGDPPRRLAATIRWLAGASFTLYLVHQPVLLAAVALSRVLLPDGAWQIVVPIGATIAVVLALAELGERRKAFYSTLVDRMIGHLRPAERRLAA